MGSDSGNSRNDAREDDGDDSNGRGEQAIYIFIVERDGTSLHIIFIHLLSGRIEVWWSLAPKLSRSELVARDPMSRHRFISGGVNIQHCCGEMLNTILLPLSHLLIWQEVFLDSLETGIFTGQVVNATLS